MVTYIVDDGDSDIEYLCPNTKHNTTESYYKNTWTSIGSKGCGDGWFRYTFQGQGVNVMTGLANSRSNFSMYNVQLDANAPLNLTGDGSYQSTPLTDGEHTITYATGATSLLPKFDYLTVAAGERTAMRDKTVIVDDHSTNVAYMGSGWTSAGIDSEAIFGYARGAYEDTVHWVRSPGNALSFEFFGSSVSLYGILPSTANGSMSLQYSLDGQVIGSNVVPHVHSTKPRPMYPLFEVTMSGGHHTLGVNVTAVHASYAIGIDFITYTAAFDNVSEAASPASRGSSRRPNVGAIVGGVLGGLIFVGVVLWVLNRRRQQRDRSRAAAAVIGRNYNSQLDVKTTPAREVYPMVSFSA